ncbi:MAG: restriction endonuclease subunit S [Marinoscillum sp.]
MPQNWKTYKLDDIVTKLGDGLHGTPKYVENGEYAFINGNNLQEGRINIKPETKRVDESQFLKYQKELNDRTILISINGTLGRLAYYHGEKVVLGKSACYFNIKNDVDKRFVGYSLTTTDFRSYLENTATGSVIKNVPLKAMREYPIVLPPLPEQQAIAEILSSLDDKIELNLQMNKTLEEMAMTLYKHWFVDFGPFKEGEFIDSELRLIPEGWEVSTFDTMLTLQRGFDLPSKKRIVGKYPVFAASGRSTYHNEMKVKGPGITTGRSGVLGKVFFIHEDFWPLNTALWVKNFRNSSPYHAYGLLNSIDLKEFNSGSAVPTLNRNDVHRQMLVIPPISIINKYDKEVSTLFEMQYSNYNENQTLTNLRDTLLPKLISGEVRVKDVERTVAEVL